MLNGFLARSGALSIPGLLPNRGIVLTCSLRIRQPGVEVQLLNQKPKPARVQAVKGSPERKPARP